MGNQLICSNNRSNIRKANTLVLSAQKFKGKFTDFELTCLALIYKDLAARSNKTLSRDTFIQYFNIIGLWGEQIFNKFSHKQEDCMNFDEFMTGLDFYLKCPAEKRIRNLFQLYDLRNSNGIEKNDFLLMLHNYSKEDLKNILTDQLFLEEENIVQNQSQTKKQRPRKGSQDFLEQSLRLMRKASQNMNSDKYLHDSNKKPIDPSLSNCSKASVEMLFPSDSMCQSNGIPLKGFGINFCFSVNGQQIEVNANLNLLVRKYVDNVYKLKQNNLLCFDDFQLFISKHPNLMKTLYSAFNFHIWGVDPESQEPNYKNQQFESLIRPIDIGGELFRITKENKIKNRYCELYPQVFMVFRRKTDLIPIKIINLNGLIIQEKVDLEQQKFGFEIYHVDQQYHSKIFYCQDEQVYKQWVNALQAYFNGEINKNYSILQKIGEGRFSLVYKCQNKTTKQDFALKIINKLNLAEEERDLLRHEVDIMKLMTHPCIIKLIDNIENRTHIHLITELVDDGDLFDYVQRKQYLDPKEAALILSQLIDALQYIHDKGIVHRDIKAENIMIVIKDNQVKQVKLIDFGFANYVSIIQERKYNEGLCGTPNYTAPEVLTYNQISYKVDNFALGAILYLMISGFLPFDSELPQEIVQNTIEGNYEIEDEFWQVVDDDCKDLLQQLLKTNPLERISLKDAKQHPWLKKMLPKRQQQQQH